MVYRIVSLAMVALALAMFVGGAAVAADGLAKDQKTQEGTVLSVANGKLVMKAKDGNEQAHNVAANAIITCDGKACKLADLKVGDRVRVTLAPNEANTITQVEALELNKTFGISTEKPRP